MNFLKKRLKAARDEVSTWPEWEQKCSSSSRSPAGSISDSGKWVIGLEGTSVFVSSDDFTHDAQLLITGDFPTLSDKVEYARWLVCKLNGN